MNANRHNVTSIACFLHALDAHESLPRAFHWGSLEHASFLPERRLATQLAALKGCEGLTSPVAEILADCMHVHSIRLLTIWHETPDMEEMVYLILEKLLRGSLARRSKT